MKILITGSEGNIGRKLVPYLKSKGHQIHRCDIVEKFEDDYTLANINTLGDFYTTFMRFRPDAVYHLAAMVSRMTCEDSPGMTIETNLYGLYNVIALCQEFKSRLIYFSTSEVYGNIGGILKEDRENLSPNNLYGLSKYLGEKLVQYEVTKGLNAIIVRPVMFYDEDETLGCHRSAMIRFAENLVRGNKIMVHRNAKRSWMHISDGVAISEKLLYAGGFHVVNIGSEHTILMSDFAKLMCDYLGIEYEKMVQETDLPERMTLTKYVNCDLQWELTNYIPKIKIEDGIKIVIDKVKSRI
jgi:nucleoside-diphosphate-sugar epimerase